MDVDDLLSDPKLNSIFRELKIDERKRREICMAFHEHFSSSSTPDVHSMKISSILSKISTKDSSEIDLKHLVKEITSSINRHAIVFNTTTTITTRLQKLEEKSKLYDSLILSYEISSLYIDYLVKPVLLRVLGSASWDGFCNQLARLADDIDLCQEVPADSHRKAYGKWKQYSNRKASRFFLNNSDNFSTISDRFLMKYERLFVNFPRTRPENHRIFPGGIG